jgi:hypothetical protein
LPSVSAVALTVRLAIVTVTASPGAALPQMGIFLPCCSTAWSAKSGLGVTSASATELVLTSVKARRLKDRSFNF